ncbi:MAG TPA: AAA family ATPase, partial [Candidatus Limnocylindrales bacterium]|nr:AAA family ATPase [Candidatus Limnocylindrales bacterium]
DSSLEYYALLREDGREIPALMVLSPRALDRLSIGPSRASVQDEYFTRPYSAESLRWRVEAMCIRSVTIDDGSGPVIQSAIEIGDWQRRATVIAIFNPKGGVGKTTVATSLASALQIHHGQRVLLVDADTVTGHVTTSLGLEQVRTVADSWHDEAEGGPSETLLELAAPHPSGMSVVSLTTSPLNTEILDPHRMADAISASRRGFDFIIVDLHPSYSLLNQAIFQKADRILVPVTPDVPALRAAVQLRDVAAELRIASRLALIVNRANSGVSVADMERTVGMPALALIRSGGLLFVRAANEGRTVVEMYPKERITEDFIALADQLVGTRVPVSTELPVPASAQRASFRLFGRAKDAARV